MQTALDKLFNFPDEAFRCDVPSSISPIEYMLAYTAVYNWATFHHAERPTPHQEFHIYAGYQIYPRLEVFYSKLCTELHQRLVAQDHATVAELLQAYVQLYSNYSGHFVVSARIFTPLDDLTRRDARGKGQGWLKCPHPEVIIPPGPATFINGMWQVEAQRIPAEGEIRRDWLDNLDKHERSALEADWELPEHAVTGDAEWISAVSRAEAGHHPEAAPFVSVKAIALRRWRIHLLEPLVEIILDKTEIAVDAKTAMLVVQSMKDVGWRKDDGRRERIKSIR
jgi:hypothetical protein